MGDSSNLHQLLVEVTAYISEDNATQMAPVDESSAASWRKMIPDLVDLHLAAPNGVVEVFQTPSGSSSVPQKQSTSTDSADGVVPQPELSQATWFAPIKNKPQLTHDELEDVHAMITVLHQLSLNLPEVLNCSDNGHIGYFIARLTPFLACPDAGPYQESLIATIVSLISLMATRDLHALRAVTGDVLDAIQDCLIVSTYMRESDTVNPAQLSPSYVRILARTASLQHAKSTRGSTLSQAPGREQDPSTTQSPDSLSFKRSKILDNIALVLNTQGDVLTALSGLVRLLAALLDAHGAQWTTDILHRCWRPLVALLSLQDSGVVDASMGTIAALLQAALPIPTLIHSSLLESLLDTVHALFTSTPESSQFSMGPVPPPDGMYGMPVQAAAALNALTPRLRPSDLSGALSALSSLLPIALDCKLPELLPLKDAVLSTFRAVLHQHPEGAPQISLLVPSLGDASVSTQIVRCFQVVLAQQLAQARASQDAGSNSHDATPGSTGAHEDSSSTTVGMDMSEPSLNNNNNNNDTSNGSTSNHDANMIGPSSARKRGESASPPEPPSAKRSRRAGQAADDAGSRPAGYEMETVIRSLLLDPPRTKAPKVNLVMTPPRTPFVVEAPADPSPLFLPVMDTLMVTVRSLQIPSIEDGVITFGSVALGSAVTLSSVLDILLPFIPELASLDYACLATNCAALGAAISSAAPLGAEATSSEVAHASALIRATYGVAWKIAVARVKLLRTTAGSSGRDADVLAYDSYLFVPLSAALCRAWAGLAPGKVLPLVTTSSDAAKELELLAAEGAFLPLSMIPRTVQDQGFTSKSRAALWSHVLSYNFLKGSEAADGIPPPVRSSLVEAAVRTLPMCAWTVPDQVNSLGTLVSLLELDQLPEEVLVAILEAIGDLACVRGGGGAGSPVSGPVHRLIPENILRAEGAGVTLIHTRLGASRIDKKLYACDMCDGHHSMALGDGIYPGRNENIGGAPICRPIEGSGWGQYSAQAAVKIVLGMGHRVAGDRLKLAFSRAFPRLLAHTPDNVYEHLSAETRMIMDLACQGDGSVFVNRRMGEAATIIVSAGMPAGMPENVEKDLLRHLAWETDAGGGTRPESLEAVVYTSGALGQLLEGNSMMALVIRLLVLTTCIYPGLRGLALDQLHAIATAHGSTLKDFVRDRYRIPMGNLVSSLLPTTPQLLDDVATHVCDMDPGHYAADVAAATLPKWVLTSSSNIVDALAARLGTGTPRLIASHLPVILAHLFLNSNSPDFSRSWKYLHSVTGSGPKDLLHTCKTELVNQLALQLGAQSEAAVDSAINALELVSQMASQGEDAPGPSDAGALDKGGNKRGLAVDLRKSFLGIMDFINQRLLARDAALEDKKTALRAVGMLIKLMGPSLSAVRPKVMATLKLTLSDPKLTALSLDGWLAFVKALNKEHVGPILSQVVAHVVPYIDSVPGKVEELLRYLILENKTALAPWFGEIHFMPATTPLREIHVALAGSLENGQLSDQLLSLMAGMEHESVKVRLMALNELRRVLGARRAELNELVLNEKVATIVPRLMKCLLVGAQENSRHVRLRYAEALGELGALDPGRLQLKIVIPSRSLSVEESESVFARDLITGYLVTALRAAQNTYSQDRAGYAIQMILKCMGLTEATPAAAAAAVEAAAGGAPCEGWSEEGATGVDTGKTTQAVETWLGLPEDVREIVVPFLSTKYDFQARKPTTEAPLFQDGAVSSYRKWVSDWCTDLIWKSTRKRADVFAACRGVVKNDLPTAQFLLLHLIQNVVCFAGRDDGKVDAVLQEFLSVLRAAGAEEDWSFPLGGSGSGDGRPAVGETVQLAAQTVFKLYDSLRQWVEDVRRVRRSRSIARRRGVAVSVPSGELESRVNAVEALLHKIPQRLLASASYNCGAHARAFQHYEQHLRKLIDASSYEAVVNDENIGFLQRIYSGLEEPDGLVGIASLRQGVSKLEHRIVDARNEGRWTDALTYYEQAAQSEDDFGNRLGALECLQALGHHGTMITHVSGLLATEPDPRRQGALRAAGVRAALRLGNWADVESMLAAGADPGFDVSLGGVLVALRAKAEREFKSLLMSTRLDVMSELSAAAMDSYDRAYPALVRLHVLRDVESAWDRMHGDHGTADGELGAQSSLGEYFAQVDERLKTVQDAYRVQEPVLMVRRLVAAMADEEKKSQIWVGETWLRIARHARVDGQFQSAASAVTQADALSVGAVALERAKLAWDQGQKHLALSGLQAELEEQVRQYKVSGAESAARAASAAMTESDGGRRVSLQSRSDAGAAGAAGVGWTGMKPIEFAEANLLIGQWMQEMRRGSTEQILSHLNDALEWKPKWENGFFALGRFHDELFAAACRRLKEEEENRLMNRNGTRPVSVPVLNLTTLQAAQPYGMLPRIMLNYGRALIYGHTHVFEALPRMLTLWFDFTSPRMDPLTAQKIPAGKTAPRTSSTAADQVLLGAYTEAVVESNKLMNKLIAKIPAYQWMTVLSQLVSRICHGNEDVYQLLEKALDKVICAYPRVAMWAMMGVVKSSVPTRRARGTLVVGTAKKTLGKEPWGAMSFFADQMITIANHKVPPEVSKVNMSTDFRALYKSLPLDVTIPTTDALTPQLPVGGVRDNEGWFPFANELPTVVDFDNTIELLSSLIRPKKVTMRGSDGQRYVFLCKPKDDLRKDARLMDVNSMLNRLFRKSPAGRKRDLHINTYSVTPLNEECGVIEWVPNLMGLRMVLLNLYRLRGNTTTTKQIKELYKRVSDPLDRFLNHIQPLFPPVFYEWFLTQWPEPTAWFEARLAYVRTTAVMSIAGYVLGLGDRHGENVLFHSQTGETMHVDFNCLFFKGLTFDTPEMVPFRLTRNMTDAMGLAGYNGVFRIVCEITLSLLRENRRMMVSVLETFIHDPLVEWSRGGRGSERINSGESENPQAVRIVADIQKRLEGQIGDGVPMSIAGHVDALIREATSPDNLSKMFIGWAPWY